MTGSSRSCLDRAVHIWIEPFMSGSSLSCLDRVVHVWIESVMSGSSRSCLDRVLIEPYMSGSSLSCLDRVVHVWIESFMSWVVHVWIESRSSRSCLDRVWIEPFMSGSSRLYDDYGSNTFLPNGLCHPYELDKCISNFRSVWCTFFISIIFRIKILISKQCRPEQMPHSEASELGLHHLPMSQKRDARLIWVKV